MQINVRKRGRIAASLAVSMALFGGAAAVTATPAQSAEPAGDCTPAYPMESLAADLEASLDGTVPVEGATVVSGTEPTIFTGDVIGILEDGIAPGLDMVLARIDVAAMGAPDVTGIWQGMSGSPVYTEGGDLIGAVAYGLTWGSSNVAGITPFEEMDNYLPDPPAPIVPVSDGQARMIAAKTDVTRAQASEGFSQLRIPHRVAGLTAARIEELKSRKKFKNNDYLVKKLAGTGGNAAPDAAVAEDIVAGGNLAAAASFGDITMGGVGTATSVCDGGVVAFGHPFSFLGTTTLTLHPADAIYIQHDPLGAPFKVANLGGAVGTISGDHLSGISGTFGDTPPLTDITSTVSYLDRERTGTSSVSVPDANASVTFYEHIVNHDRVIDGIIPGSEVLSYEISGDDNGTPFTLGSSDVYASDYDITFESPWEVADLVWILSSFPGVTVEDVSSTAEVSDDNATWRVDGLEQKRNGEWVKLNRRNPAIVDAGDVLKLRATLTTAGDDTMVVPLDMAIPQKAEGRRGYLYVEGGAWSYTNIYNANNVDDIEKALAKSVRNDQVVADLYIDGRRESIHRRTASEPTDMVVYGAKRTYVKVR